MSGPKVAGVVLLVATLAVWGVRSFVLDHGTTSPTATTPVVQADNDTAVPAMPEIAAERIAATSKLAGVPVGYPQSERGAATAAVNWVASFPTIVRMGPIRLHDTISQLLTERASQIGSDEVVADYLALVDELGPDFARRIWIDSPLQVDVAAASAQSATVAVWALLVTGDPETRPVEAVWRTHRIKLVWERDDWRIDDVAITEGPTPVPTDLALPSPAGDFIEVDRWEPAVFADTTEGAG